MSRTPSKRRAPDDPEPNQNDLESGGCQKHESSNKRSAKEVDGLLPGPELGGGPTWFVKKVERQEGQEEEEKSCTLMRCEAQLEQALSGSLLTDMRFVFDDGSFLAGHWAMLCGVSSEYRGMFESNMAEAKTGEVRVRGVSRDSFKGFLEFVYMGRPGQEMAQADGREVWLLADLYGVKGIKRWLMSEGLAGHSVCAAAQYALEGDGGVEGLLQACQVCAAQCLVLVSEDALRGVGSDAARAVLEGYLRAGGGPVEQRLRLLEGFRFIHRWAMASGWFDAGGEAEWSGVQNLLGLIDLSKLSSRALKEIVRPSGLVSMDKLLEIYETHVPDDGLRAASVQLVRSIGQKGQGFGQLQHVGYIAVGGKEADQRVAICDYKHKRVILFSVETGHCVGTVGSEGNGPGQFQRPRGLAFNARGELIAGDRVLNRMQIFDRNGQYIGGFGESGTRDGEFCKPSGVACNSLGDIVVCDAYNHRVQVFRADGTFVMSFGSKGHGPHELNVPKGVAIGPDGSIIVVDSLNARVQVFSAFGSHARTVGGRGDGPGQFQKPYGVGIGSRGEILVADWGRHDVQVFSAEGIFLQSIGSNGDSKVDIRIPNGIAVDCHDRIFVGNMPSGMLNVLMLQ